MHRMTTASGCATQGFAVDRDRAPAPASWWAEPVGEPCTDRGVQQVRVDAGEDSADRGLVGYLPHTGERVTASVERGQDRLGRVSSPFSDRGDGAGAGQYRRGGNGKHTDQPVLQAATVSRVADHGQALQ